MAKFKEIVNNWNRKPLLKCRRWIVKSGRCPNWCKVCNWSSRIKSESCRCTISKYEHDGWSFIFAEVNFACSYVKKLWTPCGYCNRGYHCNDFATWPIISMHITPFALLRQQSLQINVWFVVQLCILISGGVGHSMVKIRKCKLCITNWILRVCKNPWKSHWNNQQQHQPI